jgi:hypothetical protein
MTEARIRTSFGDVRVSYQNAEDLKSCLQALKEQIGVIEESTRSLVPQPTRPPKPGCGHIYRFTPDGKVEMLVFPPKAIQAVALLLFAYHPQAVSAEQVEAGTGVVNPAGKVLNQTMNKGYFRKEDEQYGLSADGIAMVQEKVLPNFTVPTQAESSE